MLFGYWLARSLERFGGISLFGVVAMSNHLHLMLRDEKGEKPAFMGYFLGNLARATNQLRGRSGACFHRRYSADRTLDVGAAIDCLAYLIANPVRAGLVARHERWPGVLLYAVEESVTHSFVRFDEKGWGAARSRAGDGPRPDPTAFQERIDLKIHALPFAADEPLSARLGGDALLALDESSRELLSTAPRAAPLAAGRPSAGRIVLERVRAIEEAELARRTEAHLGFLGADTVVAQEPTDIPHGTKSSPRPVCHASEPRLWEAFLSATRIFRTWYRAAAQAFRLREFDAVFPPYSLLPGGAPAS